MKIHKLLLITTTVASLTVDNQLIKADEAKIDAKGSDRMKVKHSFAFPIFKFKLKLPFQNTSPSSLPQGQVGSVEDTAKSQSTKVSGPTVSAEKEWTFQPGATQIPGHEDDAGGATDDGDDDEEENQCDGSDKDEPSLPSNSSFKGFGDMFMEMMNVGKDLTLEKIEVLKDILFLIDRIKEETDTSGEGEENTIVNENSDSKSHTIDSTEPQKAKEDQKGTSTDGQNDDSALNATETSSDAKIDVWRLSTTGNAEASKFLRKRDISPEELGNVISLGDLKKFLKKGRFEGEEMDSDDDDKYGYDQSDPVAKHKEEYADTDFEISDLSKLKEKLGISGKSGDGESTSKLKNIFKKGDDEPKQNDEDEESGSRKIKSHFKKGPPIVTTTLVTTITTVVNPETDTPNEDCPENKSKPKPKFYPYLHPKGEEYPEGLNFNIDSSSETEDCDEEEFSEEPNNLKEKANAKSLSIKSSRARGKAWIDKSTFTKRDEKDKWEWEYHDNEETPTTGDLEASDDSDDSDEETDGNMKGGWSWKSIFGLGNNIKKKKLSTDDSNFESTWLFKKKLRSKKRKSKPSTTTTTTVTRPKPTEKPTEDEEEDDPDCPREKKERLRQEKEEKLKKKKEALKEKLKNTPKSTPKAATTAPMKKSPTTSSEKVKSKIGVGKTLTTPTDKASFIKSKPVPSASAPVDAVSSEKERIFLLFIPDEGEVKLLTPEEFASSAPDFEKALFVKVAYNTLQIAYNIAKEKQPSASGDGAGVTNVDDTKERYMRKIILEDGGFIKNQKAIEDVLLRYFDRFNDDTNDHSFNQIFENGDLFDDDKTDNGSTSFKFEGYDSFEAQNNIPPEDLEVEDVIEKVFMSLKQSDLINTIFKLSLKDKIVRSSLFDLTLENLKNNQIPWDELLMAIQAHDLNIDFDKLTFVKPEFGKSLAKLVLDSLPPLIKKGFLSRLEVIQQLSFAERPTNWRKPVIDRDIPQELDDDNIEDVAQESSHVKFEKGHSEKHHYAKNFNSTTDHTLEHHEEKNKKIEKEDHLKILPGREVEKEGHENLYNDAKKELSEKLKDGEGIHKENSKKGVMYHHKGKYHEVDKSGETKEERFESDRHEQKKEKLEQDFLLNGGAIVGKYKRHEAGNYREDLNRKTLLHLTRRDEINQHANLAIDKNWNSKNSFTNERDKDHYESNRTLGGQLHSKEHYVKEHHEKERHDTAPGVEQYEKEKHDKEEHAKENHEVGPQEHEQMLKEHGKVKDKSAVIENSNVNKESESNVNVKVKVNGSGVRPVTVPPQPPAPPIEITLPVPGQVVLPVIG